MIDAQYPVYPGCNQCFSPSMKSLKLLHYLDQGFLTRHPSGVSMVNTISNVIEAKYKDTLNLNIVSATSDIKTFTSLADQCVPPALSLTNLHIACTHFPMASSSNHKYYANYQSNVFSNAVINGPGQCYPNPTTKAVWSGHILRNYDGTHSTSWDTGQHALIMTAYGYVDQNNNYLSEFYNDRRNTLLHEIGRAHV